MPLHHNFGFAGLTLRTERGSQALPLAARGPLLDGAYATPAELEAAETGRVVAELSLEAPGALALAIDDGGPLAARLTGDPNPQYTLYRFARVPQTGTEPTIEWGAAERLEALLEPCDFAQLWLLASPIVAASLDQTADSATGWTLAEPRAAGKCDEPIDATSRWILAPTGTTAPTVPGAITGGADLIYAEDLAADWAAAAGWRDQLALWLNSHGPFTRGTEAADALGRWHTLHPLATFEAMLQPRYDRAEAGGKGAIISESGAPEGVLDRWMLAQAALGFDPAADWTLCIVARALALTANQRVLFGIGQITTTPDNWLVVLAGSTLEGITVATHAGRQATATSLGTGWHLIEIAHAAGATIAGLEIRLDGAVLPASATTNPTAVPAWSRQPDQFRVMEGWDNTGAWGHRGALGDLQLLRTTDTAARAAVRAFAGAKFGITIS